MSAGQIPTRGWKMVPEAALKWLMGEGPDKDGIWFGDVDDETEKLTQNLAGKFWWRSKFRAMLSAAPTPPATQTVGEGDTHASKLAAVFERASTQHTNILDPPLDCVAVNLKPSTWAQVAAFLRALSRAPAYGEWQPIETAPTSDDDFFLVCAVGDDRSPFVVRGTILTSVRKANTPGHLHLHWMPLPALPIVKAKGGGE